MLPHSSEESRLSHGGSQCVEGFGPTFKQCCWLISWVGTLVRPPGSDDTLSLPPGSAG